MTDSPLQEVPTEELLELLAKHRVGELSLGLRSAAPFSQPPSPAALAWLDECLAKAIEEVEAEVLRRGRGQ